MKSYLDRINSWFNKFRKYKIGYSKGFYTIPNLANSPFTITESFDKMPFCQHDREKKLLTADTLFLKAQLFYYQLDDGLWIFVSEMNYRKNQLMNNIYDKDLPMDFHFINLHYREKSLKSKSMIVNGITVTDKTWSVFKAGNALTDYHFKDSDEKNITVYFTENWIKKNFSKTEESQIKGFQRFIESENKYLLLPDSSKESDAFYQLFFNMTQLEDNEKKKTIAAELTQSLLNQFDNVLNIENLSEDHFKLNDKDRKNIQRAEKILLDNLLNDFPGIEKTAESIGVSPTKLKSDFKTVHNKSMYQFFSYHQMQLAHELIIQGKSKIKEIAALLGYENPSKFTARYKEIFGHLPSASEIQ